MLSRFKGRDLKAIVTNFISLVVLNIVNYVFPIILIPILITRLGLEVYGKYIFIFTILGYLNLIVQYGFNFSATSKIAKHRDNIEIISETYTSITLIRFFFSLTITLSLLLATLFHNNGELYLLGIGIFLGQGLIPVWLFQGLEKMKFITLINFVIRLVAFILIFKVVVDEHDVWLLMFIQSLSFLLGALVSLFIVKYYLKIGFVKVKISSVKQELKEGLSLFLSTIGINLYRESNIVILGLICGYSIVALYSPAEKLIKGLQSFSNTIVTAIYPFLSRKISNDNTEGVAIFKKVGTFLAIFFTVIVIVMFLSAEAIINTYLGNIKPSIVINFKILSLVILFGGLNYFYGIVGLVNLGKGESFNKIVWLSGIVGLLTSAILSFYFRDMGASIAMVIAELFLLILVYYKFKNILNE
ncbi:oligosaccharide flippase family protein [Myroides odoratimimus]|uniref:oligosaccharide flippase family protein n=1 Tax=Myroides odoratimimus TaxID=76832 RepID=UPI0026DF97C0|nr:oligosaccharide flippase family protein [Myroides odoratimimus]MDO5858118.1 oligosaccharide flippase family protein [Myroides odoratimimus]